MKSNLQLFRQTSKEFIPSGLIQCPEQFKQLTNHLCDNKLLHPSQAKKLIHKISSSKQIKFPINFQQLEQIIMIQFGEKNLMEMLDSFKYLKTKLKEVKGVLNIWKDRGLTKKERYELETIFQHGNAQMRQLYQTVEKEKDFLERIYEQQQQMIDSLDEWIRMQKIEQQFKNYIQYQQFHQKLIQQQYTKIKVRQVHFRQKINTSKILKIQNTIGMDSRNDEPVEVVFLPKRMTDFDTLNTQLLTFNAKKQLMLSPHFSRFLGYNTQADQHCFFYFSQFIQGKNLAQFIHKTKIQLEQDTPLFQYWANLVFQAFYDIFLMCSYVVNLPLKLKDFEVSNSGLKLIVKHIKFIDQREKAQSQFYEAELLKNLGTILLDLLKINTQDWQKQVKIKKIENKNIISCLLNAPLGHKNKKQNQIKSKITFFNVQTHPLFESKALTMGQTIVDNFESILSYQ